MGKKEFLKFDEVETEKVQFHRSKSAISIGDVNIDKIVIFEEFPCAKKGF